MRINVPKWAWEHFWQEPPEGTMEFWAFRSEPKCSAGELLEFFFGGKLVAEAIVAKIEAPGLSHCESTGKFRKHWKVFWTQKSFRDLREGSR